MPFSPNALTDMHAKSDGTTFQRLGKACVCGLLGLLLVLPMLSLAQNSATGQGWSDLTPERQQVLAPLAAEWDGLEAARKSKWLTIADKFPNMPPERQARLQERMQSWAKLTPQQRRVARENYARATRVDPERKNQKWEQYQQLPEEQKQELAAKAQPRKTVTTLPPANQANAKTVPPIKSASKPALARSVTPEGAARSAIQPAFRQTQQ